MSSSLGNTSPSATTPRNRIPSDPKPEGTVARSIEEQTSKLPSDLFLWAAVGSMVASFALHVADRRDQSTFIGQWAPTFLILGLYNKLVKVAGSDADDLRSRAQA